MLQTVFILSLVIAVSAIIFSVVALEKANGIWKNDNKWAQIAEDIEHERALGEIRRKSRRG